MSRRTVRAVRPVAGPLHSDRVRLSFDPMPQGHLRLATAEGTPGGTVRLLDVLSWTVRHGRSGTRRKAVW